MAGSLKILASRIPGGQKGFTLIEMIVVVGIIAVLAAVIVPNIGKFIGSGEQGAQDAEYEAVQTAMNAMMAESQVQLIPASAAGVSGTSDWSGTPAVVVGGEQPLGPYLQNPETIYVYCYNDAGQIVDQYEQGDAAVCP